MNKPVVGQKVWYVQMARDSVVSGNVFEIGDGFATIKPTFGKGLHTRLFEYIWKTSKEARAFYAENRFGGPKK